MLTYRNAISQTAVFVMSQSHTAKRVEKLTKPFCFELLFYRYMWTQAAKAETLLVLQDQSSNDEYLFDLDHFVSMAGEPSSDVDPDKLPPLPKLADSDEPDTDVHLVLDARLQGALLCLVAVCWTPVHLLTLLWCNLLRTCTFWSKACLLLTACPLHVAAQLLKPCFAVLPLMHLAAH